MTLGASWGPMASSPTCLLQHLPSQSHWPTFYPPSMTFPPCYWDKNKVCRAGVGGWGVGGWEGLMTHGALYSLASSLHPAPAPHTAPLNASHAEAQVGRALSPQVLYTFSFLILDSAAPPPPLWSDCLWSFGKRPLPGSLLL